MPSFNLSHKKSNTMTITDHVIGCHLKEAEKVDSNGSAQYEIPLTFPYV